MFTKFGRRSFLLGLGSSPALIVAPSIIRPQSLMPIRSTLNWDPPIIVFSGGINLFDQSPARYFPSAWNLGRKDIRAAIADFRKYSTTDHIDYSIMRIHDPRVERLPYDSVIAWVKESMES